MLMFREEKSPEDEIKAWQFWHSRQHSVKQRILDAGKFSLNKLFIFNQFVWANIRNILIPEGKRGRLQPHFGNVITLSFSYY